MIMESAKNVRWIIPFKKFGMVRVNINYSLPADKSPPQYLTFRDIKMKLVSRLRIKITMNNSKFKEIHTKLPSQYQIKPSENHTFSIMYC